MNVIIYESSSKGGCYEYAHYLYRSFIQKEVQVKLLVPSNTGTNPLDLGEDKRLKTLLSDAGSDNRIVSKLLFLYRQFVNPIRFLFYLRTQPASIIIWNDFEQLTAPVWAPLLRFVAKKHIHTVVLHDPDRDNYPPSKWYSEYCMAQMMRVMQIGFYHGYLPSKKYYAAKTTTYLPIVHGFFDQHPVDLEFLHSLQNEKGKYTLLCILGNIRAEKNYRLIIESLTQLPHVKLLIAGAPASSAINIENLQQRAQTLGVAHRIIWRAQFLTDTELAACIEVSDVLLLYYQKQFTSQSGILNLIAPYQKKFVYSDMQSGLATVCKQYGIGIPCLPDSIDPFVHTIQSIDIKPSVAEKLCWNAYLKDADWTSIYNSFHVL